MSPTSDTQGPEKAPRPHGSEPEGASDGLERPAHFSRPRMVRAFRWHLGAFVTLNAVLALANILTGMPWWAFWPLLVTGLLLGLHYLLYKTVTVDEAWAEERAEELNLKSYDRSHIEELKSRYGDASDGKS